MMSNLARSTALAAPYLGSSLALRLLTSRWRAPSLSAVKRSVGHVKSCLSTGYKAVLAELRLLQKGVRGQTYRPVLEPSLLQPTYLRTFQKSFTTLQPPFTLPARLQEKLRSQQSQRCISITDAVHREESPLPTFSSSSSVASDEELEFYFPTIPKTTSFPVNLELFVPLQSRAILELESRSVIELEAEISGTNEALPSASFYSTVSSSLLNPGTISMLQALNEGYGERRAKLDCLESIGNLVQRREVLVGEDLEGWTYCYSSSDRERDIKLIAEVLGDELMRAQGDEDAVQRGRDGFFSVIQKAETGN